MRALVVSYVFPPTGGAGVARTLKLVKYLGSHGVRPTVLTAANPSVPVRDESLLRDVPAGLPIVRARSLEPAYAAKQAGWTALGADGRRSMKRRIVGLATRVARQALVPDAQVLWQPAAELALGRRLLQRADDVVLISGPPFSSFLLALLARLRRGVGVVLDYRDEWSTIRQTLEMSGSLPARAGAALEALVLRAAHVVTTATEAFRRNLLARFPFLRPERVVAIPNGYDPDDFPAALPGPAPDADKLTVTYAGTVFRLTSARGFLGAVRRVHAEHPALARRLRVRFLGRIVETERASFEGTEALGVERAGYLPHAEIVAALAASHLNLCLLDEAPFVERIYPAKIFELMYLAARHGRPCLTLAPPGALAELVRAHQLGPVIAPRAEEEIAAFLVQALRDFCAGRPPAAPAPRDVERFDRRRLAGEFREVLAAAHRAAGGGAST
jgi:glycosyltransferase involved in cell wall biosynthesis